MAISDKRAILDFLDVVGSRQARPERLLLLGGSALMLLGNARATFDIDYVGEDLHRTDFQQLLDEVAAERQLHVDPVPIERFVPMPDDTTARQLRIGQFGAVEVLVIDPYVIALTKLDRGLDSDLADIGFLLAKGLVQLDRLADEVERALLQAPDFDLDPEAIRRHLAVVRERASRA